MIQYCFFRNINIAWLNPLYTGNFSKGTLANSEDPDEMPQKVAFHQGLQCLLILKLTSNLCKGKETK